MYVAVAVVVGLVLFYYAMRGWNVLMDYYIDDLVPKGRRRILEIVALVVIVLVGIGGLVLEFKALSPSKDFPVAAFYTALSAFVGAVVFSILSFGLSYIIDLDYAYREEGW